MSEQTTHGQTTERRENGVCGCCGRRTVGWFPFSQARKRGACPDCFGGRCSR